MKKQSVESALVVQCEGAEGVWECEDDVEVGDLEQIGRPGLKPFGSGGALALGTVPIAARVVADDLVSAAVAPGFVTAEGGTATKTDVV